MFRERRQMPGRHLPNCDRDHLPRDVPRPLPGRAQRRLHVVDVQPGGTELQAVQHVSGARHQLCGLCFRAESVSSAVNIVNNIAKHVKLNGKFNRC